MPEGVLAGDGQADGGPRRQGGFEWPASVPFSQLGPELIDAWAPQPEDGRPFEGEHIEVTGQSGSGKSYALATILHMRALRRDSATVYIATKLDDPTVLRLVALGWPRVGSLDEVRRYRQCIFWADIKAIGEARKKELEQLIYQLLTMLWVKSSNTVVVFDEIGYVEQLSRRLRTLIQQYWREGRALGISVIASKQRPVGVVRDQHSETRWKIVFPPADQGDMERFSQLLGRPADWAPVLDDLDQELHQFVIRNSVLKTAYISWVDFPLEQLPVLEQRPRSMSEAMYGRREES